METESNTSTSTSTSRRSIAECVGDMYLDEHLADIHFSFPKEKSIQPVPAHKMILVAKSPVFKAMFCGDLAEKGSTIKITDITAKTFRQMLKYCGCSPTCFTEISAGKFDE
ncbi:BTB/POZ domain-containing protein 6-B-like isoform X2 [Mytilus galloprovincialis]|uniref:BTB/POZ domain-containing protein 6-B-like isoform X2 n=1 Tax=Mytilus galloprovincialis TaxID=29158 RepID=UPI003F7B8594